VPVVSAALTDLGLRRAANEDSYVSRPGLGLQLRPLSLDRAGLSALLASPALVVNASAIGFRQS
jgi:hypothetical protein